MITREQFLSIRPEVKEVQIADLGSVYVGQMTAGTRDRFEAEHARAGTSDFRARLAAAMICDEQGKLMFSHEDVAQLSSLPSNVLDGIARVAIELNKLSQDDVDDLKKA